MRLIIAAIALLVIGAIVGSIGAFFLGWPSSKVAQGQLRCEDAGAVVINVDGTDYAVNGMASRHYPPVQRVWNSATYPEAEIGRIIVRGLTLCEW